MDHQIENNAKDRISQEEWQFKYLTKLFEAIDLAIRIGYSTGNKCADRIEKELERPGYCESAKKYIMWKLGDLIWYIENQEAEVQMQREEISINPKDDPQYPTLERFWDELEQLECKLPSIPLYLCTRPKGPTDYNGFPLDDSWVYHNYENDFYLDLAAYIDELCKDPTADNPLLHLLRGVEAVKAVQTKYETLQAKYECLKTEHHDLRDENFDLKNENKLLESKKNYFEQGILNLCTYYSQPTGTTPEMARDILDLFLKVGEVFIISLLP